MAAVVLDAPSAAGARGFRALSVRVTRAGMAALLCANATAADLILTPTASSAQIGAAQLAAGAGSEFESPVISDVLLAILTISNTGGASWQLEIGLDGGETDLPPGAKLLLKRGGGNGEAGIIGGLAYQEVTGGPLPFCSGTGDYASVEILLQIDGLSVAVPSAVYTPTLRYSIVVQ